TAPARATRSCRRCCSVSRVPTSPATSTSSSPLPGSASGSAMTDPATPPTAIKPPLWLLAELTYACPLQCPYCSNPFDYPDIGADPDTADWLRTLSEARQLGALQLGLSGGEPLARPDLEPIVAHARSLGYYSNLITSGVGMDAARVRALKDA